MKHQDTISIVIPVFNGAGTIMKLCQELIAEVPALDLKEIILVDDHSRDRSWKEIEKIKLQLGEKLVGVQLSQNVGQHNALMCGLVLAKGAFVITMDDDLRHQPKDIQTLVDTQQSTQADLVYGVAEEYAGKKWRSVMSTVVSKSSKHFADHSYSSGSSFRILTRGLVDKIKSNQGRTIFLDEIVHWYTTKIETIRLPGTVQSMPSRYSILKLFRLYTQIVHDYASWPLKFMIVVGGSSSVFTFLLGARFIYKRMYLRVDVEGFTATIVAILFSASIILFCLGIVGLYIFKLYQIQSGKPSYTVKKII